MHICPTFWPPPQVGPATCLIQVLLIAPDCAPSSTPPHVISLPLSSQGCFSNTVHQNHLGGLLKQTFRSRPQNFCWQVWGEACESAFLTRSQVVLMLLAGDYTVRITGVNRASDGLPKPPNLPWLTRNARGLSSQPAVTQPPSLLEPPPHQTPPCQATPHPQETRCSLPPQCLCPSGSWPGHPSPLRIH